MIQAAAGWKPDPHQNSKAMPAEGRIGNMLKKLGKVRVVTGS